LLLVVAVSVSGKRGVGIPVILLHDAEGGIVTVELKNGDTYRGFLDEAQDNMNCTMKVWFKLYWCVDNLTFLVFICQDCTKVSATTGKESHVQIAYIRGSQITFIILPDMLQKA
jgi:small nuclear ribonucleoprotein D3